ncbi:MAG: protein translocase subunit SecD [Anaerolineaceae bacterium]|nr:protein translocase subunit SecD [Anaerolineaceae bacterium]
MSAHLRWLIFIIVITIFCVWVAVPDAPITNISPNCVASNQQVTYTDEGIHIDTNDDCEPDINLNVQQALGLDLVGGLRVLLQADLPPGTFSVEDLRQAANNVSRRVNALGVGEATVQVQGSDRILVELPGITDPQQAIDTIQKTALLEFVDFGGLRSQSQDYVGRKILTIPPAVNPCVETNTTDTTAAATADVQPTAETPTNTPQPTAEVTAEATVEAATGTSPEATVEATPAEETALPNPLTGQPFQTVITGACLQAAVAQYGQARSGVAAEWFIQFQLKPEAASIFGPFTASRINEPLAIVLDSHVISAPIVNSELDTGGIITGNFTEESAQTLALQLRSGALPIPLRLESAERVGATLGQESVNLSIRAGIIGIIVVLLFMTIYYRVPGIAAALALLIFVAINLAVFKLIPVTLTLPAITGFLISVGTAVDGNILIFERIKEEIRNGSNLDTALEAGFDRAWNSIRDSNLSTIVISGILFLFGQTPGASIVSGFAITLALGLIINLFTAVIVTRTFLHLMVAVLRRPLEQRAWLLGV